MTPWFADTYYFLALRNPKQAREFLLTLNPAELVYAPTDSHQIGSFSGSPWHEKIR